MVYSKLCKFNESANDVVTHSINFVNCKMREREREREREEERKRERERERERHRERERDHSQRSNLKMSSEWGDA